MRSLTLMAACIVGALLAAGCSSDGKAADTTSAPVTTVAATEAPTTTEAAPDTTEAPPTTEAPGTTEASDTTEAAPADTYDPATLTADVTSAYAEVLDGFKVNPDYLEDYDIYKDGVAQIQSSSTASQTGVVVKSVSEVADADCAAAGVDSPCASAVFDVTFQGAVAIPDNTGYTVYKDGKWQISGVTYCSLAVLALPAPPGCV